MEGVKDYLLIAFGALIGAVSTVATTLLIQWWNERENTKDVRRAITTEWHEIGHRLMATAFRIELDSGTIDRRFLEWVLPLIQEYEGPNPTDKMLSGVSTMLEKRDDEIHQYAAAGKREAPHFRSIPRIEAPYTKQAAAVHAKDLPSKYATKLFDLVAQLGMFNALVEDSRSWNQLTFSTGLSDENRAAAQSNADVALRGISERAQLIVRRIGALETD